MLLEILEWNDPELFRVDFSQFWYISINKHLSSERGNNECTV